MTEQVQDQVTEVSAAAQEKINFLLEEYQKVIPIAENMGLSIGSFKVEMGILPEIKTSLVGSIDKINKEAVQKLIVDNQNNKIVVTILNAILLTKDLQEKWKIKALKGITVEIKLGVSPNISVHLTP